MLGTWGWGEGCQTLSDLASSMMLSACQAEESCEECEGAPLGEPLGVPLGEPPLEMPSGWEKLLGPGRDGYCGQGLVCTYSPGPVCADTVVCGHRCMRIPQYVHT